MKKTEEKPKIRYPVYGVRVEEELKKWLLEEAKKYKSPNIFFKELKQRYEHKV